MVALQKPAGGVHALVMGDVPPSCFTHNSSTNGRPVARGCAPSQYALSTRAGAEALTCVLRFATESHHSTTVVGVDGVGAYDHISRSCIFDGLRELRALEPLIPFVRMFYGADGEYLFYDEAGHVHTVLQAEAGEQETRSCRGWHPLCVARSALHLTPRRGPFHLPSHARLSESSQLSVPFAAHWRITPT